jgi:DNA-binding response OmpR family regulator
VKLFNKKALIIEEDLTAARRAGRILKQAGINVRWVTKGAEGLRAFFRWRPDVVVLSLDLSGAVSWAVCRKIQQMSNVPIILLADSPLEQEMIDDLCSGRLDYLTNPYSDSMLLAKVTAVLRRTSQFEASASDTAVFDDGTLFIDLGSGVVAVNHEEVYLTKTEYRLLAYLVRHAGSVQRHEQILDHVWNRHDRKNTANVHVLISRLRQKIEPDLGNPRYLQLQYGIGYRFGN